MLPKPCKTITLQHMPQIVRLEQGALHIDLGPHQSYLSSIAPRLILLYLLSLIIYNYTMLCGHMVDYGHVTFPRVLGYKRMSDIKEVDITKVGVYSTGLMSSARYLLTLP